MPLFLENFKEAEKEADWNIVTNDCFQVDIACVDEHRNSSTSDSKKVDHGNTTSEGNLCISFAVEINYY